MEHEGYQDFDILGTNKILHFPLFYIVWLGGNFVEMSGKRYNQKVREHNEAIARGVIEAKIIETVLLEEDWQIPRELEIPKSNPELKNMENQTAMEVIKKQKSATERRLENETSPRNSKKARPPKISRTPKETPKERKERQEREKRVQRATNRNGVVVFAQTGGGRFR